MRDLTTKLDLVRQVMSNLGRIKALDALEPLLPYVGAELSAVFDPKKTIFETGTAGHEWSHCTANFLIRDADFGAGVTALTNRIAEQRQRAAAGLLLKVAFDFHGRKLDKPRLVVMKDFWLRPLVVEAHRPPDLGVSVHIDCSYAVEEIP